MSITMEEVYGPLDGTIYSKEELKETLRSKRIVEIMGEDKVFLSNIPTPIDVMEGFLEKSNAYRTRDMESADVIVLDELKLLELLEYHLRSSAMGVSEVLDIKNSNIFQSYPAYQLEILKAIRIICSTGSDIRYILMKDIYPHVTEVPSKKELKSLKRVFESNIKLGMSNLMKYDPYKCFYLYKDLFYYELTLPKDERLSYKEIKSHRTMIHLWRKDLWNYIIDKSGSFLVDKRGNSDISKALVSVEKIAHLNIGEFLDSYGHYSKAAENTALYPSSNLEAYSWGEYPHRDTAESVSQAFKDGSISHVNNTLILFQWFHNIEIGRCL